MALQLAWHRTRGEFTATYETVLTRLFKHGRTETIRALSADSRAWVLAMDDPHSPVRSRSFLFPSCPFLNTLSMLVVCVGRNAAHAAPAGAADAHGHDPARGDRPRY